MNELMEQPLWIVGMGIVATAICICGLVKTGKPALLYATIATVLVFAGLIALERFVKTDREQITIVLNDIAVKLENDDVEGVVGHIHSKADKVRARASLVMPLYRFDEAKITTIREIDVDPSRSIKKAKAEFVARLEGAVIGTSSMGTVIRIIELDMVKEGEEWKVNDYHHYPFSVNGEKQPDLLSNVR